MAIDAEERHVGEAEVERAGLFVVGLAAEHGHGVDHELHGADAIAFGGLDGLAPAAVAAALELAGDHKAVVLVAVEGLGGRFKQAPVLGVDRDDLLAKGVDLVGSAEVLEALDGAREVIADEFWVDGGILGEGGEAFVSVLPIAVLHRLPDGVSVGGGGFLGANQGGD